MRVVSKEIELGRKGGIENKGSGSTRERHEKVGRVLKRHYTENGTNEGDA